MNKYALKDNDLLLVDSKLPMAEITEGKKYILKVRDMPQGDKPREKMLASGVASLSLTELVAVVLGIGTKKEEVMSMSSRILKEYGEKSLVSQRDPLQMANDLDIPETKALQIVAAGEIGRRLYEKKGNTATIRTAKDVYRYLLDMHDLPKEHLRGIYLNTHHKVIHDEVISIGTINSNIIHPREVFRPAIEHNAAALILAHNHPSGSINPSEADIAVTKQLVEVGKILGINVVDHVIITKNGFKSIEIDY